MKKITISSSIQKYCVLLFVLYMCRIILSTLEIEVPVFILEIYYLCMALMICLILLISIKQPRRIPFDYFVIFFGVIILFKLTNWLHPEYRQYIFDEFREEIIPINGGIFGYFIIRFVRDEKLIEKGLKISAVILFIALFIQSLGPISRGYWYVFYKGEFVQSPYNMSFGYNMLIPTLIFLYYGMKENKIYILPAMVGSLEILMLGSRGAVLGILAMIILYVFFCMQDISINKKIILFVSMVLFMLITICFFRQILYILDIIFNLLGFKSRTIQRILEGTLSSDTARAGLYYQTKELISSNFWGYGLLADRYYFGVYCHNIVYEILLQLGWILGISLIIVFGVLTLNVLKEKDNNTKGIFLIFFCASFFKLLVSDSLWRNSYFWCAIGIAVTCCKYKKNKRKKIINMLRKITYIS